MLVVSALGGNALLRRGEPLTAENQRANVREAARALARIVQAGHRLVITHGNGPQVGFILLRSEIARKNSDLHSVPLVSCVADTQGAIGWQIQQALSNELRARSDAGQVVSLVTQVRVKADDPGFADPDKFVGEFYDEKDLPALREQNPQWVLKEDPGRGWRRVVPSPAPVEIVELDAIRALLDGGFHLVTVGGGGIPVVSDEKGNLRGVDAVIDKDLASRLLANALGAGTLIISTGVEKVCVNFGKPDQKALGEISAAEMQAYYDQGQFPAGSMGPKVKAALDFLAAGGERVIITSPEHLKAAINSQGGTHITR